MTEQKSIHVGHSSTLHRQLPNVYCGSFHESGTTITSYFNNVGLATTHTAHLLSKVSLGAMETQPDPTVFSGHRVGRPLV